MFLRKHMDTFGEISFTLNKLLDECGYLTNTHNSCIYKDFREIIHKEIIKKGFATSTDDILTISPSNLYVLHLSTKKHLFFTNDNFVQFTISEYETITNAKLGKVNKSVLTGVYLYIKQFILSESMSTEHCAKISYPSKQQIKKGIGISSITTIETAISILESLKMIHICSDMYVEDYEDVGCYIPTRNVYALDINELKIDIVLLELENIYKRTVYRKDSVPGKIKYLDKEKR